MTTTTEATMAEQETPDASQADADLYNAHHYESPKDMPANIRKDWYQRYDLFSRYDEGVCMTDSAWFGVTPEAVANRIATDIAAAAPPSKTTLIDLFAGAGGNSIAFALSGRWTRIFAVERDEATLACARRNAALYGVERRIVFVHADSFEALKRRLKGVAGESVLFGSPPWGGPGYTGEEVFGLAGMQPYGLEDMMGAYERYGAGGVVLYLPRTSDLNEVARCVARRKREGKEGEGTVRVTHYCMSGASKAICVFFGDFTFDS